MPHEFKYKLDFYYQQALAYLLTLIVYAGIRGTFIDRSFTLVFDDPIFFIIIFFVVMSFVLIAVNKIRDRKLIVTEKEIIFQHRFAKIEIPIAEIEWIHIGKERGVQTAGRFQIVIIKLRGRRRSFRIRAGRYERDKQLIGEMMKIAERVPKRERKFQLRKRRTK